MQQLINVFSHVELLSIESECSVMVVVRSGAGQGEVDAELVVPVVAPPAVGLLLLQLLPQARDSVLEAGNVSS